MDKARGDRLPELFGETPHPDCLYHRFDRHGVSTLAIRQRSLSDAQITAILRYRLAHSLLNRDVDPRSVYERRAEYEWWFPGQPEDVHFLVGSAASGEIVSYIVLAFLDGVRPGMTLRTVPRPQFEVEDVFGPRVYDAVAELRDLPLTMVAEGRRFVRTHWLHPLSELAIRGPAELGVGFFKTVSGPLASTLGAIVGDVEATGAQANLRFFGLPHISLETARPIAVPQSYPPAVRVVRAYPVAVLTRDLPSAADRVAAVDAALSLPGRTGVQALFDLIPGTRSVRALRA